MTFRTSSEAETIALGAQLGKKLKLGSVVSLRGSLGVGKTVFAKGIAEALGITEAIVSPTFTLIQEYEGTFDLYHMDLYRIDSSEEFELIGGDEYLYGRGITLIEWSEKIQDILPQETIYVTINLDDDGSRLITIEGIAL
ncbi:MAG: tRNA (adenosine(37)-N6)-threonylcarbamoyltransferase complex ATPase subunit type 1 TsaE [Sphaerochaeta sp.]